MERYSRACKCVGGYRYQELWSGLGAQCHVVRPTVWQSMVPSLADRFAKSAHADLLAVAQQAPADSPIIAHCFSNGGFLCFSAVLRRHMLEHTPRVNTKVVDARSDSHTSNDLQDRVCNGHVPQQGAVWPVQAVIFDSAPAPITPDIVRRCAHRGRGRWVCASVIQLGRVLAVRCTYVESGCTDTKRSSKLLWAGSATQLLCGSMHLGLPDVACHVPPTSV